MQKRSELLGSSNIVPLGAKRTEKAALAPRPDDGQYGVFGPDTNGEIIIRLGHVPEFRLPREAAFKLGCLMLKRCGIHIEFDGPAK